VVQPGGSIEAVSQGAWVLVVALALAIGFGCYRALADGRFRGTRRVKDAAPEVHDDRAMLSSAEIGRPLGERATLLQFSSAFCAPCRATRRVLADVAAMLPGVAHVEVDAEMHLELVRRLGIVRTPTTLVLDAAGCERSRAAGAPRKENVLASLAGVLDPPD
jgi:thiol-disulfide isomerase/thioredoxin